jgi:myo-inositol-1(or 4)-monophosphatase
MLSDLIHQSWIFSGVFQQSTATLESSLVISSLENQMSDSELLPLVVRAAQAAGALLGEQPPPPRWRTWPEFKAAFDAVDVPVSRLLRDQFEALRPGVEWSEELDAKVCSDGEVWVVDAVDGAIQYLQGLPQWSVSIALVRDGRPVVAVLHSARLDETYTAVAGGGAFLNGIPVTPSTKDDPALSIVATSHPPFVGTQPDAVAGAARAMSILLPATGAIRNLGPTSWQVADVASGRLDAFWEYGRDDTNLIAAALVAREAGAVVTDTEGRPWQPGATSFLAAPAALHAKLIDLLAT